MSNEDLQVQILHEHYNNTFSNIQGYISRREHLFLFIILLSIVLLLQMSSPLETSQQIWNVISKKLDFNMTCNLALIDSIIWFGLLCLIIRYCQTVVCIERQYEYIHSLEDKINNLLGQEIITREGKAYLSQYPRFSDWTNLLYKYVFPILLGIVLLVRWKNEFWFENIQLMKVIIDGIILIGCVISLLLYMKLIHFKK